jgi:bifunctional non-homologous end joining protein LigD
VARAAATSRRAAEPRNDPPARRQTGGAGRAGQAAVAPERRAAKPLAKPHAKARAGDASADPLARYSEKRNFGVTPEPPAAHAAPRGALGFVIQKHWATRLHYDFRLELDGVLLSWAVPKGPSFDPAEKRLAMHVEDHPVAYGSFEGTIPPRQYGAGKVIVWDNGWWAPVGDAKAGLAAGKLVFDLHGQKLAGRWELVRIRKPGEKQDPWILFKKKDPWARPLAEYDVISALPDSVVARPLGAVEEREQRGTAAQAEPVPAGPEALAAAGAKKAALPATLKPQLATLSKAVPADGQWLYEIKFDGYRLLARIDRGRATLFTRNGHDWSDRMKPLVEDLEATGVQSAWLDGEIVVLGDRGVPDFNALQKAFDVKRSGDIVFCLFDVPYFEGHDLRAVPLVSRRALLKALLDEKGTDRLRFSADFAGDGADILQSACKAGLEGVIAKRRDAAYVSARTESWLKLKCAQRQEFVVIGYSDRSDGRPEVGSLLLGYHDEHGTLRSAGSVGTGWNAETAAALHRRLTPMKTTAPAVDPKTLQPGRWSRRRAVDEHWVAPRLVTEVSFAEWTPDGQIRHAVFQGLREDKPAKDITRERAAAPPPAALAPKRPAAAVKVSNPDRVIDASTGIRKIELVHYYESVAEWMLPHLKRRPVSLVRGPTGVGGELFFQKHDDKLSIPKLRELDPALWPGHAALLEVPSAEALANAAQMNVIEFHTWNSTTKAIDQPDRIVFDLDPGEGVGWPQVQEGAALMRALLEELGLEGWLKTSGGKGLHVVVPVRPQFDYDTVKDFSQAVVQHLARTIPSRFVAKSGPANRKGRIFVDYLRNGHGQTTAAAFSARARPGMGVSMPVGWDELPQLKSGAQWTIRTARERLSFVQDDPWAGYWTSRQRLTAAMKRLGFEAPQA